MASVNDLLSWAGAGAGARASEELVAWCRRCRPRLSRLPRLPYISYLLPGPPSPRPAQLLGSARPTLSRRVRPVEGGGGVRGGSGLARLSRSWMSLGVGLLSLPPPSPATSCSRGLSGTGGPCFLRAAAGDLEPRLGSCWPRCGDTPSLTAAPAAAAAGSSCSCGAITGVTDLELTSSLAALEPGWLGLAGVRRCAGGEVEKLLCSERERSLVSLTGLGFLTLS